MIKNTGRKKLKPITNMRTQDEAIEVSEIAEQAPEIVEQLQRSRGRHTIMKKKRHEERHVENPRENDTHTSTLFLPILDPFLYRSHLCNSI